MSNNKRYVTFLNKFLSDLVEGEIKELSKFDNKVSQAEYLRIVIREYFKLKGKIK